MSDLPICYNSKEMNGWQVWQLRGRLDRTTAEEAAEEGEKQLAACRKLALELSGLSYVSSAGLRTILKLASGAEQAGKSIVIISSEGMVREILEMARLDLFITIHDSVDDLKNV